MSDELNSGELYEGELSFDDAMASFRNSLATDLDGGPLDVGDKEVSPEPPPGALAGESTPEDPAQVSDEGNPPNSQEAAPEPQPQTEPEVSERMLERLVQREAKAEEKLAKAKEMLAKAQESEYWKEDFTADPVGFLRSNFPDLDLRQLAKDSWYESQGASAPDTYRSLKEARAARAEALKARRGVQQAQVSTDEVEDGEDDTAVFNQYVGKLHSFAEKPPTDKYPLTAKLAERNADRVKAAAYAHVQRVAQATNGERVLTPEEAVAELEKELQELQLVDVPAQQPAAPTEQEQVQAQPTSLRNSHSQVQHDRLHEEDMSDTALRVRAYMAIGKSEAEARRLAAQH